MGRHVKSRCSDIAFELMRRIKACPADFAGKFPTRAEIAREFAVSELTAYRVLSLLEERGVISCGRGRRASLSSPEETVQDFATVRSEKVGVIYESTKSAINGVARALLVILMKLRADGCVAMPIEASEFPSEDLSIYSGFVLLVCEEGAPAIYDSLRASGKPYAGVTFSHLRMNSVCVISKHYVMELAVYIMRERVRKLLIFQDFNSNAERYFELSHDLHVETCFREYGYDCEVERRDVFPDGTPEILDAELDAVMAASRGRRLAIVSKNNMYAKRIYESMTRRGIKYGRDYLLISYCAEGNESSLYSKIDFRLNEYVRELLLILYRQFDGGTNRDVGAVHMPYFVCREL